MKLSQVLDPGGTGGLANFNTASYIIHHVRVRLFSCSRVVSCSRVQPYVGGGGPGSLDVISVSREVTPGLHGTVARRESSKRLHGAGSSWTRISEWRDPSFNIQSKIQRAVVGYDSRGKMSRGWVRGKMKRHHGFELGYGHDTDTMSFSQCRRSQCSVLAHSLRRHEVATR